MEENSHPSVGERERSMGPTSVGGFKGGSRGPCPLWSKLGFISLRGQFIPRRCTIYIYVHYSMYCNIHDGLIIPLCFLAAHKN